MPDWIGSAWDAAATKQLASDALSAYYEGLLLKDDHPSVALLASVAAIEAVGQTLLPGAVRALQDGEEQRGAVPKGIVPGRFG